MTRSRGNPSPTYDPVEPKVSRLRHLKTIGYASVFDAPERGNATPRSATIIPIPETSREFDPDGPGIR